MKLRLALLMLLIVCAWLLSSCRKEKDECPSDPVVIDGRDQYVGQYEVYDTNGLHLYSMEIMKSSVPSGDSLFVINWANRFNFWVFHDNGDQSNQFNIIPPYPSYDHLGNRWAFSQEPDPDFMSSRLINDTLRMSYLIDNIAFYFDDGVPYFSGSFREYGVKQ